MGSYTEYDTFGGEIKIEPPTPTTPPDWLYAGTYSSSGNPFDGNSGCSRNGFPMDCSEIIRDVMFGDPRTMNDTNPNGAGGGMWLSPEQMARLGQVNEGASFDDSDWIGGERKEAKGWGYTYANLDTNVAFKDKYIENRASSADCGRHKKFLLRPDVISAFQKSWDNSDYGVEGKQIEQGGAIVGEPNVGASSKFENKSFTRIPDTPVNRLDGFKEWQKEVVDNLPESQKLLYYYHTHPFKVGVPFPLSTGASVKFESDKAVRQPSYGDHDTVLSGSLGVIITKNKLILFDKEKVLCDFDYNFVKK